MDKKLLKEKLDAYFAQHRDDLVESVCRLVRIRSDRGEPAPGAPYGEGPAAALAEGAKIMAEMGFPVKNYDNRAIAADFSDKEKGLDMLAHLDCVPVGDDWTVTGPFDPIVKDGILYGRGVIDDKGPAMCALWAMKAVKDLGLPLSRNVRLILGSDEESGSSDIAYYYKHEEEAPMTFSPDASYPLINIEKGGLGGKFTAKWEPVADLPRVRHLKAGFRGNVVPDTATVTIEGLKADDVAQAIANVARRTGVEFTATDGEEGLTIGAQGLAGHASTPEVGNNALTALLALIATLPLATGGAYATLQGMAALFPHGDFHGAALGVDLHDKESGWLTLALTLMEMDDAGLTASFDCRSPICATEENLTAVARASLAKYGLVLDAGAHVRPPHAVSGDSDFVRTLLACYELYTGVKGEPVAIGGGTYVHSLKNGVAFGVERPGVDYHMHGANEFVPVDELVESAGIFAAAIAILCA